MCTDEIDLNVTPTPAPSTRQLQPALSETPTNESWPIVQMSREQGLEFQAAAVADTATAFLDDLEPEALMDLLDTARRAHPRWWNEHAAALVDPSVFLG